MNSLEDLLRANVGRFYLGVLCQKGHEYGDTGKSIRYREADKCVDCQTKKKPYLEVSPRDIILVKQQLGYVPEFMLSLLDPTKYALGSLCHRGHEVVRGQSLKTVARGRDINGGRCVECAREIRLGISQSRILDKTPISKRLHLGTLCRRKHDHEGTGRSLRYNSTNWCVECAKKSYFENQEENIAKAAERRAEKGEEIRYKCREYRLKNIDRCKEYDRFRYKRDREKRIALVLKKYHADPIAGRQRVREQYYKHREKRRAYWKSAKGIQATIRSRVSRKTRLNSIHSSPYHDQDLQARKKCFDDRCAYCDRSEKLTLDHFLPISLGGADSLGNIIFCCSFCNSSKNNRDPMEWYKEQPFFSAKRWQKILKVLGKTQANYNQIPLL